MLNLSVFSFQKYFPDARFVVAYHGDDYSCFMQRCMSMPDADFCSVEFINQHEVESEVPKMGYFWKFVPISVANDEIEVYVDEDYFAVRDVIVLKDWINNPEFDIIGGTDFFWNNDREILGRYYDDLSDYRTFLHSMRTQWKNNPQNHVIDYNQSIVNGGFVGVKSSRLMDHFLKIVNRDLATYEMPMEPDTPILNVAMKQLHQEGVYTLRVLMDWFSWWRPLVVSTDNLMKIETLHFVGSQKEELLRSYPFFRYWIYNPHFAAEYPKDIWLCNRSDDYNRHPDFDRHYEEVYGKMYLKHRM